MHDHPWRVTSPTKISVAAPTALWCDRGMERARTQRQGAAEPDDGGGAAAGRRTRVAAAYPTLARKLDGDDAPSIDDAATAAVEHKDGGTPVDGGVAARVGAHLGADLSGVRVHSDPLAQEASAAIGARAFAHGGDVFLARGESPTDLGLMAHELTHVAQQGAAGQRALQRKVEVGAADSPAEREADAVASAVTGGAPPRAAPRRRWPGRPRADAEEHLHRSAPRRRDRRGR